MIIHLENITKVYGFCVNLLCGLIAYCHQPKKPSLDMDWILTQSA
jgi:hypothetical protein